MHNADCTQRLVDPKESLLHNPLQGNSYTSIENHVDHGLGLRSVVDSTHPYRTHVL